MAAHVITALKDIKDHGSSWDNLQCALNFSCWTELLEIDDYAELQRIVNLKSREALNTFITLLLPKYTNKWYLLNCPGTMEAWINNEYAMVVNA
jgi:hypothetical protein